MCSDSWTRLLSWRKRAEDTEKEWSGTLEEEGKAGKQDDDTEEVSEGEDDEEEDLLKIAGFWGPHRLLFTIMEEPDEEKKAVEELEQQQPQACKGRGSRAGSRASSELLFVDTSSSCSTSPFVTPSSSPPFATPLGSPASPWVPLSANPFLPCKPVEVDSTSSSSTSSSSPRLLGRTPLSRCREGNSSLSPSLSSSSLSSTPAVGSPCGLTLPPPFVSSPCCKQHPRHPLGLLLDPLPLPNSGPHCDNRVYPLTVECSNDIHTAFSDYSSCKSSGPPSTPPAFHIPPPSQPTTPRPFRASLHLKRAASAFPSPSHSNVVAHLSS
ncbi:hypothetical protein KP509_02G007200 [Ceratopteris richardii]|nr:hypothetical protein KP509_02G007200 [Ceratopteris richardii]